MLEDKELVRRITKGDEYAFRLLVTNHERLVVHVVSKLVNNAIDIEDLCQEVFLKVFKKISSFKFQSKLSTWIATIAYNTTVNELRKKRINIDNIDENEFLINKNNFEESAEHTKQKYELKKIIRNGINQLPSKYKTLLILYHYHDFEYKEIAKITEMPEGTVKNYLFRARNLLKEKLNFVVEEGRKVC